MNVITGFGLFLGGAFLLIVLALLNVLPTNYLGGFVIACFIGGLFFAWLNAWRQGEHFIETENSLQRGRTTEQALKNYPCMKETMLGTRRGEGQACIYSASRELAPIYAISPASQ
jgi:hypothetical protein